MKKILFVTHYPGIGGANLSMVHLINNLMKYHNITPMVYIPVPGPITGLLDKFNISYEIHRYISWRTQDQGLRNIAQSLVMLILNTFLAIKLLYKVRGFDVIYSNSSKVVFGAFLKFFTSKRLIWHLREFGTFDYPMIFLLPRKWVARIFKYANVCIAISREVEDVYRTQFSPHANYKLVYNGVELNDYFYINPKKNDDMVKICMVGGFEESKNQEDLIRAIAKLDSLKYKIQVDFYGDNNTRYGKEMMKLADNLDVNRYVTFKGQIREINKVLPSYHIGVITSKYEAFGRVVVEYMLSNLAVIATDTGACPELVDNGKTGLIYHLGDSEDLSKNIQHLLDNHDVLHRLSKKGREYAMLNFTAEINANNIANIIRAI